MKLTIENGMVVGTAEWLRPGEVRLEMSDPQEKEWFERYFSQEDCFLAGDAGAPEMVSARRDDSEESFIRAAMELAAFAYTIKRGDGRRWSTRGRESGG